MTNALYYAATGTTAIAEIMHLSMTQGSLGFNLNAGILFLVAGIARYFG